MSTLNSGMSNGYKRFSCLDCVKLPNHTQFLLLQYKQINKNILVLCIIS